MPDKTYAAEVWNVFYGVFGEQCFERIGMVIYTRTVAQLGAAAYAVHAVCMNFCDFYYSFAGGLGKAGMILAGHAYGKGSALQQNLFWRTAMKWGGIFSFVSFAITYLFRFQLFGIYVNDATTFALGGTIMIFVAAVSFPEAHSLICAGILRAGGKTTQVAIYSLVSIAILRPIITVFLVERLNLGLAGAWTALFIDQSLRATCAHFLLCKYRR